MSDRVLSSSNSQFETITNSSVRKSSCKRVKRRKTGSTMGATLRRTSVSTTAVQTTVTNNSQPINGSQTDSTVDSSSNNGSDNTDNTDNTNDVNDSNSSNSNVTSNLETINGNNTDTSSNERQQQISVNEMCIDLTDDSSNVDDSEIQFITAITGDVRPVSTPNATDTQRSRSLRMRHRSRRRTRTRSRTPITRTPNEQQIETLDITSSPINERSHSPSVDEISNTQNLEPSSRRVSRRLIKCPICLDEDSAIAISGRQLVSTTCGHVFCDRCISEVIRTTKACPNCRKKITSRRNYHPIYI